MNYLSATDLLGVVAGDCVIYIKIEDSIMVESCKYQANHLMTISGFASHIFDSNSDIAIVMEQFFECNLHLISKSSKNEFPFTDRCDIQPLKVLSVNSLILSCPQPLLKLEMNKLSDGSCQMTICMAYNLVVQCFDLLYDMRAGNVEETKSCQLRSNARVVSVYKSPNPHSWLALLENGKIEFV